MTAFVAVTIAKEPIFNWLSIAQASAVTKGIGMSGGRGLATLILSIDLELGLEYERERIRRLDEVRAELVALTRTYAIPATWAVADPRMSAATESIVAAGCGHEIAVLGDQAWLGPGCGRARLSRELTRRFDAARQGGIAVTTLALWNLEQVCELDLLLEHGVTALRGPAADRLPPSGKQIQPPIRFGLWQPPTAWKLPPRTTWWSSALWSICSEIRRAIRQGVIIHLQLEASRLIAAPETSLGLAATVLNYVASKRDAGQLDCQTIGNIATEVLRERAAIPSRSILRPAA